MAIDFADQAIVASGEIAAGIVDLVGESFGRGVAKAVINEILSSPKRDGTRIQRFQVHVLESKSNDSTP